MPKSMLAMWPSLKKNASNWLSLYVVCVVGVLQQLVVQLARLIKMYDEKL